MSFRNFRGGVTPPNTSAVPTPENATSRPAPVSAPVWQPLVSDTYFQEDHREGIRADQNRMAAAEQHNRMVDRSRAAAERDAAQAAAHVAKPDRFETGVGTLRRIRGADGVAEDIDPESAINDPVLGQHAAAALLKRDIATAKADVDAWGLKLQDPSDTRKMRDTDLAMAEGEIATIDSDPEAWKPEALAATEARKKELWDKVNAHKARAADEQSAYDAKVKLQRLGTMGVKGYLEQRAKAVPIEQRQAAAVADEANIQAREAKAAQEEQDLRDSMARGLTSAEMIAAEAKLATIQQTRAGIEQEKARPAAELAKISEDAKRAVHGDTRPARSNERQTLLKDTFDIMTNRDQNAGDKVTESALKKVGDQGGEGMARTGEKAMDAAGYYGGALLEGLKGLVTGDESGKNRELEGVLNPALEGQDLVQMRKDMVAKAANSTDPNLLMRADALGTVVRHFESKGITDGREMTNALIDAAKVNVWGKGETDMTRTLSDGTLAINPALVAERDGSKAHATIDATDASPAEKARAKDALGQARQAFATNFTQALLGRNEGDFKAHVAAMQQAGVTNPEEVLFSWNGLNSGFWSKNWAVVRDSAMMALRGIDDTLSGVFGAAQSGIASGLDAVGANAAADWFQEGAAGMAEDIRNNRKTEEYNAALAAARGERTGIRGVATDLGSTVGQMAPMFVGGPAAKLMGAGQKGAQAAAAAGVYGWAGMQGYSSLIGTALQEAEAKVKRPLTQEESVAVFNENFAPALTNAVQTAILSKVLGGGVERAALGKATGNMTLRDMYSKVKGGGLKASLGELKPELVALVKTIGKDFADEAVEESVNQLLEGIITKATVSPDLKLSDLVEESIHAGLLGGLAGAGVPLARSAVMKGEQQAPNPNQGITPPESSSTPPAAPAPVVVDDATVEDVKAAMVFADPKAEAPSAEEVSAAQDLVGSITDAGPDEVAEGVLLARDFAFAEQNGDQIVTQAEEALRTAQQGGDKGQIAAAEADLERAKTMPVQVNRARAVVKVARGAGIDTLTDGELKGLGITREGKPLGKADLEANGLTKPLVELAEDGSPILLDEAVKLVKGISPDAAKRVGMTESQARAKAKARAEAAAAAPAGEAQGQNFEQPAGQTFEVTGRAGTTVEVQAADETAAMEAGAVALPMGEQVASVSSKQVAKPSKPATPKAKAPSKQETANPPEKPDGSVSTDTKAKIIEHFRKNPYDGWTDFEKSLGITREELSKIIGVMRASGELDALVKEMEESGALDEWRKRRQADFEGEVAEEEKKITKEITREVKTAVAKAKGKLKDRIKVAKEGSTRATEDGITINDEDLVKQAVEAGFDPERARKWANDVIDEEVRHHAHLRAARDNWKASKSTESFEKWRAEHYGRIWAEDFAGERGAAVAKIYGSTFEALEPWQKAMEGIRMMSQVLVNGDPTEVSKLWSGKISKALRDALRAALRALRELTAKPTDALKAEIDALERKLQEIDAAGADPRMGSRVVVRNGNGQEDYEGEVIAVATSGSLLVKLPGGQKLRVKTEDVIRSFNPGESAQEEAPSPLDLAGEQIGTTEWYRFKDDSGTLGIPRDEMPQIAAEDRSAMVQFLRARGIDYADGRTLPSELKPTQAEFSAAKVDKARAFQGGDRAILVSEDGYVVDGHHQWLAKWFDAPTEGMRTITLKAPLQDILAALKEMPSVETAGGGTNAVPRGNVERESAFIEATESDPFQRIRSSGQPSTATANFAVIHEAAGVPVGKDVYDLTGPELLATLQAAERLGVGDWYSSFTNSWAHEIKGKAKKVLESWLTGERPTPPEKRKPAKKAKAEKVPESEGEPAAWADFQAEYRKLKTALAKARKTGDPRKIFDEAVNGLSRFEVTGLWPDNWSDWERAKDDALMAIQRGEKPSILKPLVEESPEAPATPAANPPARSEAEQALVDLMKDMVDGLEAAPLVEDFTRGMPPEKILPMVGIAQKFIAEGIDTPEAFAGSIAKLAGGKLKPYSQALWGAFVMVNPSVDAKPDWAALYAEIEAPAPESDNPEIPESEFPDKPEPLTDTTRAGMRAVISEAKRLALTGEPFTRDAVAKAADPNGVLSKKELDESIEAGIVAAAHQLTRSTEDPAVIYQRMVKLYSNQPSLNAKTSESKINQAYSTPIPLAYVASRLADTDVGGDVIYEPTAGHGALLIDTAGSTVIYNELDQARRFRTATALDTPARGWQVTGHDATTWNPEQKPNKIVANPPFGSLMIEGGRNAVFQTPAGETTAIDHAIMLKALENMTDDGTAVFIIGGPAKTAKTDKARRGHYARGKTADFFKFLHENYGVVDHFTVDGDLYKKQGAGWNVDVILIRGKRPTKTDLPGAKAPRMVSTWEELFQTTELTDDERIQLNRITEAEVREQVRGMADKLASIGGVGGTEVGGQRPSSRKREDGGTGDTGVEAASGPESETTGDAREAGRVDGGSDGDAESRPSASRDAAGDGAGVRESSDGSADAGGTGLKRSGAFQVEYRPFSGAKGLDTLIPNNMAEPAKAAFERIKKDVGGDMVAYVREKVGYPKGSDISPYLAGEQIDAVAAAIWNFERGGALVIGDQTGIGKGRIAAALMKYAVNNNLVPVFMSQKPGLHHDMLTRDLVDVGAEEVVPAVMDSKIQFDSAKERKLPYGKDYFEIVAKDGALFGGANAIFVTYDQIQADDAKGVDAKARALAANAKQAPAHGWRTDALKALAPRSVIILDESHLASGQSKRGWRTQEVLKLASRVYYSSATAVKRPENMGIYFKTNVGALTGGNVEDIVELMTRGGVPAMQVVSSMLARDGQYLRRERSFEGIKFATQIAEESSERDIEMADHLTWALRNIVTVQDAMSSAAGAINDVIAAKGKKMDIPAANRARLESVNFASKLHNIVSQYLLAIKTQGVADMAISEIKAGKKVVVSVQSTMESALDALEEGGFPLTYKGLVLRYLDQMRFITSGKKSFGKGEVTTFEITGEEPEQFKGKSNYQLEMEVVRSEFVEMPDGEGGFKTEAVLVINDEVAKELMRRSMWSVYQKAEENVKTAELGNLPLSPIDALRQAAEDAGIRTGEITGRDRGIDRAGEIYERSPQERDKKNNPKVIAAFNDEDLDFLVINQSGSTGISLHASEKAKNKATRVMIVAQPNLDINEFMQTLGRIHRSGQVKLPEFVLFQTALPAEKRPAAILGQKMGMLNANTTSNAKTDVSEGNSAVDIFNKYGDEITRRILDQDADLQSQLRPLGGTIASIVDGHSMEDQPDGFIARTITGYLAVLPVEEQTIFWEKALKEYTAYITYLNQIGKNELEAKAMDIEAETISSEVFTPATGTQSAFEEASYLETVDTKLGTEPLTGAEAIKVAQEARGKAKALMAEYPTLANKAINESAERKARRTLKWDEDKERAYIAALREQRNTVAGSLELLGRIGSVERDDGTAGIGVIEEIDLDEDSLLAPSAHIAIVRVNDSRDRIKIPLSQLQGAFTPIPTFMESAEEWDDSRDVGSKRIIITGNLIAAMQAVGNTGKVITYTTKAGEDRIGILMPKSFEADYRSTQARVLMDTASKLREQLDAGATAESGNGRVRIYRDGRGKTTLAVPSSRSGGGDLWRSPELNKLTAKGLFEQTGSEMRAEIPDDKLGAVLEFLTNEGQRLYVTPDSDALMAAPLDDGAPAFYSGLDRLLTEKLQETSTPPQVMALINTAKAEEVKWSGIRDAVIRIAAENKGKVPKAALLEYVRTEGRVQFEEVTSSQEHWADIHDRIIGLGFDVYEDNGIWLLQDEGGNDVDPESTPPEVQRLFAQLKEMGIEDAGQGGATRYSEYSTPGGTNYREVVLTMPERKSASRQREDGKWEIVHPDGSVSPAAFTTQAAADRLIADVAKSPRPSRHNYTSSHFPDTPGYVAHMRLQDFGDGTLIEEIQSDRHQAGRKQGYQGSRTNPTDEEIREYFKLREGANPADYREEMVEALAKKDDRIADAPYRKDWPLAMFKRALSQAVAAGKKWIGWTTGETQNDRFDISKEIGKLYYNEKDGTLTGETRSESETFVHKNVTPDKLADYVGKDVAERMMKLESDEYGDRTMRGDALKIAGGGMKGFYDNILPKEIGKYVKQWGAKVEEGTLGGQDAGGGFEIGPDGVQPKGSVSTPIWRVEITPAMRESVKDGQALFAAPLNEDEQITEDLMEKGRKALPSEGKRKELRDMRREFEDQGKVIGRPVLANISEDDEVRGMVDEVDEWRKFITTRQQRADWEKEGKRMAYENEDAEVEKWLAAAYDPEKAMTISPQDVVAIRVIMERRAKAAGNDKKAHADVAVLVNGYREARAQQARVLAAGTDPYKNPEERNRDYLAGVLYEVPAAVLSDISSKAADPASFRKMVRKAVQERLDKIEGALKKQGVTLDEILGGQVFLSLSQKNVMKEATKELSAAEQAALKIIQKGGTVADVKRVSGLSEAQAQKMLDALKAKLREQLREKVAKGMKLEDLRDELNALKAAPLGDDEIEAELERILSIGFGLPDKIPQQKLPKSRTRKPKPAVKVDWTRPEFTDALESYEFNAEDRADIMQNLQALREAVGAEKKIEGLPEGRKAEARKMLAKLDKILRKYGTNAEQLAAGFDVDSYRFDIRDRHHVLIIARAIQAIDADWIDKGAEWYYASILSGLQTMAVNATGAVHSVWEATFGRAAETAVNFLLRDPKAASLGEVKYILRAMGPMLGRAWSNAMAAWGSETPFFEEDILGKGPDLQQYIEGRGMYRTGSIAGKKGRIIRTPMRILLATDEFVRTATACAEVGAMAYRLARADGLKPGTKEFDEFLKKQVNIQGSPAWVMAAVKASDRAFTAALPGQRDVNTGKKVEVRGVGDVAGLGAGMLTRLLTHPVENKIGKAALMALRLIFFPFQRVPFNILRTAARRTVNPVSLFDIGVLVGRNLRFTGGKWTLNAKGEKAEIVERIAMQAQGAMGIMLLAATGMGEGDDDDLEKPILITGSRPFKEVNRGERELAYRMGLGPYSISIRRKDGSRLVFSYGRLEPAATVLGATVDTMREIGFAQDGKQDMTQAANKVQNALISLVTEKTFMRGFSDIQQILSGQSDTERFIAERLAVILPNILRQPIRESDPAFREKPDGFMEALSYALWPHGQVPERHDIYGDTQEKRGNAVSRTVDFMDWGSEPKARKYDEMMWRYRQSNPNNAIAPQAPALTYTDPVTRKPVDMNPAQAARFKDLSGKRTLALLGQETFNFEKPTESDMDRLQSAVTRARTEVKKMLVQSPTFKNLK